MLCLFPVSAFQSSWLHMRNKVLQIKRIWLTYLIWNFATFKSRPYIQGFARSLHTSAKAPHACSRLPGNFCNGAVFVGAAYSALGLPQTDRTRKRCRKHKQTLLCYKSCQAISSMRVHLCAKTAQNPVCTPARALWLWARIFFCIFYAHAYNS